jgi:hypothetical protein
MAAWLYAFLLLFGLGAPPGPGPAVTAPGWPDLDRIAAAVEGVESSFGTDQRMWRTNPSGPQGPMQVSAAAAADVGSGANRLDPDENRRMGRAYLTLLYQRYGNWRDALVAYYWGPGNVDRWTAAGHDETALSDPLRAYVDRLRGFLIGSAAPLPAGAAPSIAVAHPPPPEPPLVDIRTPALRKTYLADRAAIEKLRDYLDATRAAPDSPEAADIMGLIRHVAARPGFREFAPVRAPAASPATQAALRQIAAVLIDKLRAECAAIVIVDQRKAARRS